MPQIGWFAAILFVTILSQLFVDLIQLSVVHWWRSAGLGFDDPDQQIKLLAWLPEVVLML